MRQFFCEIREGNTDTLAHYFFEAEDLQSAAALLRMYCLGAERFGGKLEVQSLGAYKVKGRKYGRLG